MATKGKYVYVHHIQVVVWDSFLIYSTHKGDEDYYPLKPRPFESSCLVGCPCFRVHHSMFGVPSFLVRLSCHNVSCQSEVCPSSVVCWSLSSICLQFLVGYVFFQGHSLSRWLVHIWSSISGELLLLSRFRKAAFFRHLFFYFFHLHPSRMWWVRIPILCRVVPTLAIILLIWTILFLLPSIQFGWPVTLRTQTVCVLLTRFRCI